MLRTLLIILAVLSLTIPASSFGAEPPVGVDASGQPGVQIDAASSVFAMPSSDIDDVAVLWPTDPCKLRYRVQSQSLEETTGLKFYLLKLTPTTSGWVREDSVTYMSEYKAAVCGRVSGDTALPAEAKSKARFKLLTNRLNILSARLKKPLYLNSGYRTQHEQQILYSSFLAGFGAPADPPGISHHQKGWAADVEIGTQVQADSGNHSLGNNTRARRLAKQLGLKFPHSNEPWHVELASAPN